MARSDTARAHKDKGNKTRQEPTKTKATRQGKSPQRQRPQDKARAHKDKDHETRQEPTKTKATRETIQDKTGASPRKTSTLVFLSSFKYPGLVERFDWFILFGKCVAGVCRDDLRRILTRIVFVL
jgi:hypothetical protein